MLNASTCTEPSSELSLSSACGPESEAVQDEHPHVTALPRRPQHMVRAVRTGGCAVWKREEACRMTPSPPRHTTKSVK